MFKAFGKKGDFIDQLGSHWFDMWKAKVCQTVLVATMHAECSVVRILCIRGGPNCDEEYKAIPDLEKAVKDDMMKQNGREVEVVSEWMSMELFETHFGSQAKDDIPAQVAADEAAAAKHANIARAASSGDLAAVRGHLRHDQRCVDQLFVVGGAGRVAALHPAAFADHTAVVEFLLEKGAAVDVRSDPFRQTPLHSAAWNGSMESAKLLLAAKASVDIKNNDGKTPLEYARERDHTEIVNLMMGKA